MISSADQLQIETTPIPGLLVVHLPLNGDERGWFKEHWQREKMVALGLPDFGPVQQNVSFNASTGVTRGLHAEPWDKYVSVANGAAFGAWVDLRPGDGYGQSYTHELGPDTAVFVPRGVANGFQTLTDNVNYTYLVNDHWSPEGEYAFVNLADPALAIPWPIPLAQAVVSDKDRQHPMLSASASVPPRRTVVLGGGGQLGLALRKRLADATFLERSQLDLTDPEAIAGYQWDGVGVVVNAAAYTAVDQAETAEGRRLAWAVNATAVRDLAALCIRKRITLVTVSTDYVFDGREAEHDEAEPLAPLGVYGASKAAGELAATLVPQHYVIRTSWVVGEGANFVRTMEKLASSGVAPSVINDQHGRLTFAEDLADSIGFLLETGAPYGIYNVSGGGEVVSWYQVAAATFEALGHDSEVVEPVSSEDYRSKSKGDPAPRPANSAFSLEKIRQAGYRVPDARERLLGYLGAESAEPPTWRPNVKVATSWVYERPAAAPYDIVTRVPAVERPNPLPLFYNRSEPPLADSQWPESNTAPRLRLLGYSDLHVYPRHVLVDPGSGQILPPTFKKHRHHAHNGVIHLGDDKFELRDRSLRGVRPTQIDHPIYVGDSEYPGIYGHDLIEVLVAAWAWSEAPAGTRFVTSTRNRPYLVDLLSAAGVPQDALLFFDRPLAASKVLFPEAPIVARRYVHPVAEEVFGRVKDTVLRGAGSRYPERVYVSRSRVLERPLVNELAIEAMAEELGFTVIHPQELGIAEQIRIFAAAKMIMGTGGSAMHNAVFSPPDARVLMLSSDGWVTVIDSLLDGGRGRLGYVMGAAAEEDEKRKRRNKAPWIVDPAEVRSAMKAHFQI